MEIFTPSRNWGGEWLESLWWVAQIWAYTAVATMVALVLIVKLTPWGRQFWRVTSGYFTGPDSVRVWLWLAFILLLVIIGVRIDVLLSYWSNDMYSAAQTGVQGLSSGDQAVKDSGVHGFWMSWIVFAVLATLHVARTMLDLFIMQRFMLAWRVWLTDRLTGDWLTGRAYYRTRFIDDSIDNPDQRIQADIDVFTTGVDSLPNVPSRYSKSTLLFGAIEAIVSMFSFAAILWGLSANMNMFGWDIPKALFFIGLVYVVIASIFAFWIGRPIIRLAFNNEKYNAAFRYALVRLRDAAESVAFYRGEAAERLQLQRRFEPVVANYRRYIGRMMGFLGFNLSISQSVVPLPWLIQAPRMFAGEIRLGDVTQSVSAFGSILDGLSFFRNAYDAFAGWQASIIRLNGLVLANSECRDLPQMEMQPSGDSLVELDDVEVRTPDGDRLVDPVDLQLNAGDTLVITGRSGAGKTMLLRSLASLWPYTSGTFRSPDGANETLFLSQLPYVPLGDLRAVVSYPHEPGEIPDDQLRAVLTKVALPNLVNRLDEVHDWAKVLSPGEQQRIAFARILLTKPKVVFLDEASSALDEGLEYQLYHTVRTELPDTVLVSVAHRSSVSQHHEQRLELLGGGPWRLSRIDDTVST